MLNKEKFISLYRALARIRLTEERIVDKYPEQKMRCPVHLSIGQEAVAVGVCDHLDRSDLVYSTHRCHAHYLAKGGSLKKMIAEIYGKETGCCRGHGGSMHLIDLAVGFGGATPIVGNSLPVAVGAALAKKFKNEPGLVVAFLGDGTVEEGVFHECLNFAKLHDLLILFVCENNFFSVYTPLAERQPAREIYKLVEAHGLRSAKFDGYDFFAVWQAAGDFINGIRQGGGPAFLEFSTYRWRTHCGPEYDGHLGYRDEEETRRWQNRDFINVLARQIDQSDLARLKDEVTKEIDEAFVFAETSSFPDYE